MLEFKDGEIIVREESYDMRIVYNQSSPTKVSMTITANATSFFKDERDIGLLLEAVGQDIFQTVHLTHLIEEGSPNAT